MRYKHDVQMPQTKLITYQWLAYYAGTKLYSNLQCNSKT